MSKKKRKKSQSGATSGKPRSTEDVMKNLQSILNEQNFDTAEQANDFLKNLLQQTGGDIPQRVSRSDLDRAQEIMYDAWESNNRAQRIRLARKALQISEDCADAYMLLGDESAKNEAEATDWYEKGVAAGRRALGDEFEEMVGHFWGMIETRPYMRCRLALANALWDTDKLPEAAGHMQEMLKLNPNDNQGVRDLLSCLLAEMGDDKALAKLLKQYAHGWSAYMGYSEALLAFRQSGSGEEAERALERAQEINGFVPDFLLGVRPLPDQAPDYYSPGDEREAIHYVLVGYRGWQKTAGALDWLHEFIDGSV